MRGELHYDAVVIGAGTAGLVAGARLAEGGARVCVLAKGVGSTHLAPGTIDVLGYAPERVDVAGARRWRSSSPRHPDHPYALLGADAVAEALEWFARARASRTAARLPLRRRPRAQPPAADRGRRAAPVGAGARDDGRGRLGERSSASCVVGTRDAARLPRRAVRGQPRRRSGSRRAPVEAEIEVERADQNALGLARRFDDPSWRAAFAGRLALEAAGRRARRTAGGARDPRSARRLVRPRASARPARVRDPHAAAVGAGHAPVRDPARGAARAPAGGSCSAPRS